jgi:hypothetical protein
MANSNGWGDGAANNTIGWGQGANNAIGWGDIHADSWAGATDIVGVQAASLLLDTYTGAAVAYSLRKLRTDYSGNAIRVRRSSDNTEQDFGFSGNDLDTASLLTFCGAGNGFITTWYDQSTNANNATQATAANQAQIVSSGALILDADTSKITSTWTADRYALTNGISTNTQYFSISMWRRGATTTDTMIHLGNLTGNNPCSLYWVGTGTSYSVRSYMSTLLSYENVPTVGRCIMTSLRNSSNLKVAYRNGVQLTNTATQAPVSGTLTTFGQLTSAVFTSGQYQEYIYWDSEQSANRTEIEDNINTYWDAY